MATPFGTRFGPVVLVLASTLFAFVIGEFLVRLVVPVVPATLDDRSPTFSMYEPHPVLGWRPRPNLSVRSNRFDATFTTNSRGLRDGEHPLERSPGVRRIVVLGDSFTWGWGVNNNQAFPQILESRLPRTEIVNLGVSAFGLRQEFDYLKLEGLLYQPDIVILALCQNDIYRDGQSPQEKFRAMAAPRQKRAASGFTGPLKAWLSERVALYRLVQQAINTSPSLVKTLVVLGLKEELLGFEGLDPNLMPAMRNYPPRLQSSFDATEAELLEVRDWLAQRKIRLILALIPALQAVEPRAFRHSIAYTVFAPDDFELDKPYRNLEAFAHANGIEVINAYPALKRRAEAGASLYLRNDVHFNAAGHEAFAAEILAHLQRSE